MAKGINPADLGFFSALASSGSLGSAARELGITTAAVSKRLAQIEERLGISLVNRTTRRMSLTPEGEAASAPVPGVMCESLNAYLAGFSREEWQDLLSMLRRMLANVDALEQAEHQARKAEGDHQK